MRSRPHRTEHTLFSRLVHLLLLVGLLLSSQGVAPALCLMAAVMDGEHAVKVRASETGEVNVVLSHEGMEGLGIAHQHDPICTLVVAFSQKPVAGEPDHVLAFKSVEDAARTLRRVTMTVSLPAHMALVSSGSSGFSLKRGPVRMVSKVKAPAWSPGLEIKTGRMILRC